MNLNMIRIMNMQFQFEFHIIYDLGTNYFHYFFHNHFHFDQLKNQFGPNYPDVPRGGALPLAVR